MLGATAAAGQNIVEALVGHPWFEIACLARAQVEHLSVGEIGSEHARYFECSIEVAGCLVLLGYGRGCTSLSPHLFLWTISSRESLGSFCFLSSEYPIGNMTSKAYSGGASSSSRGYLVLEGV